MGIITRLYHNWGVWIAAGFEHLRSLRAFARDRAGQSNDEVSVDSTGEAVAIALSPDASRDMLPPLVGWTIIGHEWKFHISWKDIEDDGVSVS